MSTDNGMQTTRGNGGPPARTPDDNFKAQVFQAASKALTTTLGSAQGQKAAMRVTMAFFTALRNAKNPGDLMRCSAESIQACVANSAETSLMPGGPYPSVWLVPRAGQRRWEISHRGIISLAQRAGYGIRASPVHNQDPVLVLAFGEVVDLIGRQIRQRCTHAVGKSGDLGSDGRRGHDASSRLFMVVENSFQTLRWTSSMARPSALMP